MDQQKANLQNEILKVQAKLDQMEKDKDALLLQREAANKTSSPAEIAKFYKEEQTRVKVQKAQVEKDKIDAEREAANLKADISELEKQLSDAQASID